MRKQLLLFMTLLLAASNIRVSSAQTNGTNVIYIGTYGYYYIVSKCEAYEETFGAPAAMYTAPEAVRESGLSSVYFDKFDENNAHFIFKLIPKADIDDSFTEDGFYGYYAQNVVDGWYLNTGDGNSWYGEVTTCTPGRVNAQLFKPYGDEQQYWIADETDSSVGRCVRNNGNKRGTIYGWTTFNDNVSEKNKGYNTWELIPVNEEDVASLVEATRAADEAADEAAQAAYAYLATVSATVAEMTGESSTLSEQKKANVQAAYDAIFAAQEAEKYDVTTTAADYAAMKSALENAIVEIGETPSANYYEIADEPSASFETGKTYVLKNAYNGRYLSTNGGTATELNQIEKTEIWTVEPTGNNTFYLKSVAENGYWQYVDYGSKTFDETTPYDGFDWYGYAGMNAEFGEQATAQEFTILAPTATSEDSNSNVGQGIVENSYVFAAKDQVLGMWYKLGVVDTQAALEPWKEDVAWLFYEATIGNDIGHELELALAAYAFDTEGLVTGTAPGYYKADNVAAYNMARESAELIDTGTATQEEIRNVIDNLAATYQTVGETNPIVEGYYFIVSAGNGPGYYAGSTPPDGQWYNDENKYAMYNADGVVKWDNFDNSNVKYVYKFEQAADGNWNIKNVINNTYIEKCKGSYGADVTVTESAVMTQELSVVSPGKFGITWSEERGLVTLYSLTASHNGSKNGEADPGNINAWGTPSEVAKFGVNVWYLIPVSDGIVQEFSQYKTITYFIDGEVYTTQQYKEGEEITPPANPTKEGYTFSGWSEYPSVMGTENIVVTGTFTERQTGHNGDVDGNGYVNTADLVAAYNYIINGASSGYSKSDADVNGNGDVNSADIVAIYNYIQTGEKSSSSIVNNSDNILSVYVGSTDDITKIPVTICLTNPTTEITAVEGTLSVPVDVSKFLYNQNLIYDQSERMSKHLTTMAAGTEEHGADALYFSITDSRSRNFTDSEGAIITVYFDGSELDDGDYVVTMKDAISITGAIDGITYTSPDMEATFSVRNGNVIGEENNTPSDNITFADANVKAICVSNWDTDGDGELSYDEAAAVTDLGEVFYDHQEITSFNELQYFTGLTSIGDWAFESCLGLTSVAIPNSVTSIGDEAFYGCTGLTSITIPESVTSIGIEAFGGCMGLISIDIPTTVTNIGEFAFDECTGLTSIIVEEGNPIYDSRDNCNAIIQTADNTLILGCKGSIIPTSVRSIGYYAFMDPDLTSITLPNSVTSIGESAFYLCGSLASVTSEITEPFTFGEDAFAYISDNCVLYVPQGTRDAYIAAGWTEDVFKGGIVEMSSDVDYSTESDIIYINNVRTASAKQITVPMILNNSTDISDIQFDLYLPEGVTIAKEDGYEIIDIVGRTTAKKHTINCLEQTDGSVRIMCTSSKGYTFSGNSGKVLELTLDLADMEEGDYIVRLRNCVSSNAENTFHLQDTNASITIVNYTIGDINADGSINVGDLSRLISMILDKYDTVDNTFRAADVNCDGKLNVGDYSKLVQMILNASAGSKGFSGAALSKGYAADLLSAAVVDSNTNQIAVSLRNNGKTFNAMQFDVVLPEGLSIDMDAIKTSSRTEGMNIYNNGTRVVVSSLNGKAIKDEDGAVLYLPVKAETSLTAGTYEVEFANAVLGTVEGEAVYSSDFATTITADDLTGVGSITSAQSSTRNAQYFDLNGRKVTNLQKGEIYIINGKTVKK